VPAILLVEDEAPFVEALARYLRAHGYEVAVADSGEAALRALEARHFDVVVTDINMPDGDGIELITHLQERGLGVPIVAISGGGRLAKEHLLEDAGLLGAAATLAKPFDAEELRGVVDRILGSKA
jgi:DNA-binding response OmpR family regulator